MGAHEREREQSQRASLACWSAGLSDSLACFARKILQQNPKQGAKIPKNPALIWGAECHGKLLCDLEGTEGDTASLPSVD